MNRQVLDRVVEISVNILYLVLGLLKIIGAIVFYVIKGICDLISIIFRKLYSYYLQRTSVEKGATAVDARSRVDWRARLECLLLWAEGHWIQVALVVVAAVWAVWKICDNETTRRNRHLSSSAYMANAYESCNFEQGPVSFGGGVSVPYMPPVGSSDFASQRIERECRRRNAEREQLGAWINHQMTRPIDALERDLRDEEARLQREVGHAREMQILQDQCDRKAASWKGQTMDQFHAEDSGYRQVFPKNLYGSHDGDPNLLMKDGKLYKLLPSGDVYEINGAGNLSPFPSANFRK